jgi:hypothetical protein
MSIVKPAIIAFAAAGVFAVSVPAWSQSTSASIASAEVPTSAEVTPSYDAEVMPTANETQRELSKVGAALRDDERSSFYSPVAENDYLEARRQFALGQYDRASDAAEAAEASLPDIPNWKSTATTPHVN